MTTPTEAARFLIIDDHPLFREALHSAVQMTYPAADTVEARTVAEALEILEQPTPSTWRCSTSIFPACRASKACCS